MAYNITTSRINGLFSANEVTFTKIDAESNEATLSFDLKDTKDPTFILFNLTDTSEIPVYIELEAAGGAKRQVMFTEGAINVLPITSGDYIDTNGKFSFKIFCDGSVLDMINVKVGAISYTPVINH